MKINFIKLASFVSVFVAFTSCQDDKVEPIVSIAKPDMSISFPTAITVNEGDLIPFTLTLASPVNTTFPVYVTVYQNESTATGVDSSIKDSFNTSFQTVINVPAFSTLVSGNIEIKNDDLKESVEKLVISFGDSRTSAVNFVPVKSTITINNVIGNKLDLVFRTDRKVSGSNGFSSTLCELTNALVGAADPNYKFDIDYIVLNSAFVPVTYPGNAAAQTGNCVEKLTMKLSDYPNGLYHIEANLFGNAGLDTAAISFPAVGTPNFDIPVSVDYLRSGGINFNTFVQDGVNQFNNLTPVNSQNPVVDVLISTVGGVRKFTLQSPSGSVLASGRSSVVIRSPRSK